MGYDPAILHRVRALAGQKEAEMKELDLYRSGEMKAYLENLSAVFLQREKLTVNVVADGRDGLVACTTGDSIYINCESCISSRYDTPEDRWVAFMGVWFHEIAHCMYLDFEASRLAMSAIERGELYGKRPVAGTEEERRLLEELDAALKSSSFRPVFREIYHTLDNTFSDRHDEDCLIRNYGGLCEAGIRKARESLLSFTALFEETLEQVRTGSVTKLAAFYNTLLVYSRFDTVPMMDNRLWQTSELLRSLRSVEKEIRTAGTTGDREVRWENINRILAAVWPYIRSELGPARTERQSPAAPSRNGQGAEGSGAPDYGSPETSQKESREPGDSGDGGKPEESGTGKTSGADSGGPKAPPDNGEFTREKAETVLRSLCDSGSAVPRAPMPAGRKSSRGAVSGENGPEGAEDPERKEQSRRTLEQAVRRIRADLAENRAEEQVESELASRLLLDLGSVEHSGPHREVRIRAVRNLENMDRELYDKLIREVRPVSRRLQKSVRDALKDTGECVVNRHLPSGRILVPGDTYRPDGLYYARKKLPGEKPQMAVSLLVDCSGSMMGERMDAAKKAAVMLYDFASALEIPVYVAGHAVRSGSVWYETCADFEQVTRKDRFRICAMRASGCNRDGCAIEISADLLARRPERIRLLLIISDGQPNHNGYCGAQAAADIQSIIRKYRKAGVEIAAAGIGGDRDQISGIYGDAYLDISDLQTLPGRMTRLVMKRLLAGI